MGGDLEHGFQDDEEIEEVMESPDNLASTISSGEHNATSEPTGQRYDDIIYEVRREPDITVLSYEFIRSSLADPKCNKAPGFLRLLVCQQVCSLQSTVSVFPRLSVQSAQVFSS